MEAHGPGFWRATSASQTELARWMKWAIGAREEDSIFYARRAEDANREGAGANFTIIVDDDVAGGISLLRGERIFGFLEVGYWLRSDLCGRGLMTEALAVVCAFGFEDLGLHRVELRTGVQNEASRRVAEKVGFQPRGILRECVYMDGRLVDAVVYDLLRPDLGT